MSGKRINFILCFIIVVTVILALVSVLWPEWASLIPLATVLMAGVTATLAFYTRKMADEARLSRMEGERYREKAAFQRALATLAWDIQRHDRWFKQATASSLDWFSVFLSDLEALFRLGEIHHSLLNLLDEVVLPASLLRRFMGLLLYTQELSAELLNELAVLKDDLREPMNIELQSRLERSLQHFKGKWSVLRFYQRQLACYILAEAKRRGFQEIAEAFEATSIFEPAPDMAKLSSLESQFSLLPPEPDGPDYLKCKREELLMKAKQKAEEEATTMKESLDAGGV